LEILNIKGTRILMKLKLELKHYLEKQHNGIIVLRHTIIVKDNKHNILDQ